MYPRISVFCYVFMCLLIPTNYCLPLVRISVHQPHSSLYKLSKRLPNIYDNNQNEKFRLINGEKDNVAQYSKPYIKSSGTYLENLPSDNSAQTSQLPTIHLSSDFLPSNKDFSSANHILSKVKNDPAIYSNVLHDAHLVNFMDPTNYAKHSKNDKFSKYLLRTAHETQSKSANEKYLTDFSVIKIPQAGNNYLDLKLNNHSDFVSEVAIAQNHLKPPDLQFAVKTDFQGQGSNKINGMLLTAGMSLLVLSGLGMLISIFTCCCNRQQRSEDNKNDEINKADAADTKNNHQVDITITSEIVNSSDIPTGDKDLDDQISFKDKIKVLDDKLIIQLACEKRRSHLAPDMVPKLPAQHIPELETKPEETDEHKEINNVDKISVQMGMFRQPKIVIQDDVEAKELSNSIGENISKSDTQDDISDKIFDSLSVNSISSQPQNNDVVIANTDDEDEFADVQRGSSILKSFQRAKPPKNRSPATRTSKGQIKTSRATIPDNDKDQVGSDGSKEMEATSSTSNASLSVTEGVGISNIKNLNQQNVEAKIWSKNNDMDKVASNGGLRNSEILMTKSANIIDFDSAMMKSITSVGSDIVTPTKRERNGKYRKNKDSPKSERKESPIRQRKSKEKEVIEKVKKSKESPVNSHKQQKKEFEDIKLNNKVSTATSDVKDVTKSSAANRLSASANNNIFYLIDPTVKNRWKSVGDVVGDHRKSGDCNSRRSGDYSSEGPREKKHTAQDKLSPGEKKGKDAVSPEKWQITMADLSRKLGQKENTQ